MLGVRGSRRSTSRKDVDVESSMTSIDWSGPPAAPTVYYYVLRTRARHLCTSMYVVCVGGMQPGTAPCSGPERASVESLVPCVLKWRQLKTPSTLPIWTMQVDHDSNHTCPTAHLQLQTQGPSLPQSLAASCQAIDTRGR